MLQNTNLSLPVSVVSVDFRECVKCRRCSGRLADVANTNLSLPVSVVSVDLSMFVKCRRCSNRLPDVANYTNLFSSCLSSFGRSLLWLSISVCA